MVEHAAVNRWVAAAGVIGSSIPAGNAATKVGSKVGSALLQKAIKSFKRPADWYYLRAESFYNVASYMDSIISPREQGYGGKSLHHQSHGESFMAVLMHKLKGKGLYIFDEPEAALSPTRQMSALVEIHRLVQDESQFIIATHSPILLSYPNAIIYQIENGKLVRVEYTDTEHYKVTRDFLNRHEMMLRALLEGD